MLFNSLTFLCCFLPITFTVFWLLRTPQQRQAWLAVTGYVFYGAWDWRFCGLMAFTTLVSYAAGRAFLVVDDPQKRKLVLVAPLAVDLSLLAVFKYAGFFSRSVNDAAAVFGSAPLLPVFDIVLPVGISFYTFHSITYVVDAYRRVVLPTRNLLEFAAYVSLFAQLVAGPIVRFREIEAQLEDAGRTGWRAGISPGLAFFAFGLFEKVIVADSLARFVDPLWSTPSALTPATAWLAALGYTFQLYFDFSGYSTMAFGLGALFGLRLPQNFNSPYRARDPSELWRRWHISLSTVMRDYLYKPLGGDRGTPAQRVRNVVITMLVGGLWHGANWTFVLWGAYHALLLVVHRALRDRGVTLPRFAAHAAMFLLIVLGWVLFRAPTVGIAADVLRTMAGAATASTTASPPSPACAAWILLALVLATAAPNAFELVPRVHTTRWARAAVAIVLGIALSRIAGAHASPFLYFQF